jgi:hypothetical protein
VAFRDSLASRVPFMSTIPSHRANQAPGLMGRQSPSRLHATLFVTLDQTVSALKGDVPGGSLERLGEPSRCLTVVWNASMSDPRHPLSYGRKLVTA